MDLAISKTDGVTTVVPGTGNHLYHCCFQEWTQQRDGRTGGGHVPSIELLNLTWTCTASVGSSCGTANGTGNINTTVNLLVGGTATYTVNATVSASATGSITNTATVAAPGGVTETNLANNTAQDVDTLNPTVDLAISKTDGVTTAIPGQTLVYTIVAVNAGPSNVTGATLVDTFPAELTGVTWSCSATVGSSCGSGSGSGNLSTTANLLAGGTVTYTVNATVAASATGSITNTATVAAPGGVTETNLTNNTATDVDSTNPTVDLAISKTDGVATAIPGQTLVYTIVATNAGPSNVTGAPVVDTFPAELTNVAWTCSASSGSFCGSASGSGNLNTTANLLAGGTVTYTVNATVAASATGSITNTATVAAPGGVTETNLANNTATDVDTLSADGGLEHQQDGWRNDGRAWDDNRPIQLLLPIVDPAM